jgi:DnaJ-class molecular chaperone
MAPGYRNQNEVPHTCSRCNGNGWIDNLCVIQEMCRFCNGRGTDTLDKVCSACHGTGRVETRKSDKIACPSCNGAGVWPIPERMSASQYAFQSGKK